MLNILDKVTGMNREAASKQSDSLAQSSQDIDLRKGKPAPTSKGTVTVLSSYCYY